MATAAQVYGNVRQGARCAYGSGGVQTFDLNQGGDGLFSQGLPERAEIVRLGRSYSAQLLAGNAWTLLITIPTTLSNFALQNPNLPASGVCYIIERFWIKAVTSMASAYALTPLSQLVPPGTARVAASAESLVNNLSGSSNASTAQIAVASTATGCITDRWNHHQSAIISPTTNIRASSKWSLWPLHRPAVGQLQHQCSGVGVGRHGNLRCGIP